MAGKISLVLNVLLAAAVIYLFTQLKSPNTKEENSSENIEMSESDGEVEYPSIVYVNNDSLQENFLLVKDINDELKKYSDEISSLETKFQNSQKERASIESVFAQNVQSGLYATEAEAEEAYIAAGEKAANLESRIQRLQTSLESKYVTYQDKTIALNDSLLSEITNFIDSFSSEKSVDLILLYSQNLNGLYANDKLDITEEVVSGLNAAYSAKIKE